MQNKHQKKIFVVGVPTSREGGGQAGWSKRPSLSKEIFLGLPLAVITNAFSLNYYHFINEFT